MAASKKSNNLVGTEFYLLDFESISISRLAKVNEDGVLVVSEAVSCPDDLPQRGVVGEGKFGSKSVQMAFLSQDTDTLYGTPDYCRSLVLMIDGKLMGDGFLVPAIHWSKRYFSRKFAVDLEDGWSFEETYTAPFIREFMMRLNVGGTLDYQSVDFVEQLMMVVSRLRPNWIVGFERQETS